MFEITTESLLNVAGNAALVAIVLQLLVKPATKKVQASNADLYPFILNICALVLGIGFAFLAQAAFGLDYESGLQAVLTGIGGAAVATLGYETVSNIAGYARSRGSSS